MNTETRTRRWQAITLATLLVGYSGYYVCRSNLNVVTPQFMEDTEFTKEDVGKIATIGTILYALGKFSNAFFSDRFGGRIIFVGGMFASVIATVCFARAETFLGFSVFWALNSYVQSAGWGALVQVSSRWYPARLQATLIAVLSMSYLIGDAAARQYLGRAIDFCANWREIFYLSAGTLAAIAVVTYFSLRSSPREVGIDEPEAAPGNLFGQSATPPTSLAEVLVPMLRLPSFWLICAMSMGLCLIRKSFDNWSATHLKEVVGLDPGSAGRESMYFPLVGAVAVLVGGVLGDRFKGKYGRIAVPSLILLVVCLIGLARADLTGRPVLALSLISGVAFFLMAPYSFCGGVMAVQLGGKKGCSTAAGAIDCAGYVGGAFSGWGIGGIAEHYGWQAAFYTLAGVAVFPLFAAIWYWRRQESTALPARPTAEP